MENENVSKNFIEQFIDQDIEEGHCKTVHFGLAGIIVKATGDAVLQKTEIESGIP